MSILEEINNLDDDKLEEYVKNRVDFLEKESIKEEIPTIGYFVDYLPKALDLTGYKKIFEVNIPSRITYSKYIPLYSQVVYHVQTNRNSLITTNDGGYYFVDDNSYILDFIKSIKDKGLDDFYDLTDELYAYIETYFGKTQSKNRSQLHQMIYMNENAYFNPIKEHYFSDFKGNGSAQCSEVALVVQNILTFLGYQTHYVIGKIGISSTKERVDHAFNLVEDEDKRMYLVDCASGVCVYGVNTRLMGKTAYIEEIDKTLEDIYLEMLVNDEGIKFTNYDYIFLNKLYAMYRKDNRSYTVEVYDKALLKEMYEEENKHVKVYTNNNNIR